MMLSLLAKVLAGESQGRVPCLSICLLNFFQRLDVLSLEWAPIAVEWLDEVLPFGCDARES